MKKINVLLADDHSIVRHGASIIFKENFENIEIFHANDFSEILINLKTNDCHLIVLDINLPLGKGTEMIEEIKLLQPLVKILIFSAFDEDTHAIRYLNAGADGYLNKLSTDKDIKTAFSEMIINGSYISKSVKDRYIKIKQDKILDNPLELLSNRELEIARLLVTGNGNLEILNQLNIKNSTVSTYKNRIFTKLEISNTVGLINLFKNYDN